MLLATAPMDDLMNINLLHSAVMLTSDMLSKRSTSVVTSFTARRRNLCAQPHLTTLFLYKIKEKISYSTSKENDKILSWNVKEALLSKKIKKLNDAKQTWKIACWVVDTLIISSFGIKHEPTGRERTTIIANQLVKEVVWLVPSDWWRIS